MTATEDYSAIARAFVEARGSGVRLDSYPGNIPDSLETGYKIQDAAIVLHPHQIGGWKVGRIPDHLTQQYGAERLAGPIFKHQIVDAPKDGLVAMPLLPGFAAVEAELMLRIGKTPPAILDAATAHDFVDMVCFGLEVASSPFSEINLHGPAVTVSDFGNNFGLVLGPPMVNWQHIDLMTAPVELMIDSQLIGRSCLSEMLDGPFGSVAFLNNLLHQRGLPLQPGQWVSTGAITGVHEISVGQVAQASFGNHQTVGCGTKRFERKPPS